MISHLSFSLAPGEKIALVGENGAGKTTITKLLARLYDPTEGHILLDGVDLREYDAEDLRNEIGVISHKDGRAFAVAVFTRAHRPFERAARIEAEMAAGTSAAIAALRRD